MRRSSLFFIIIILVICFSSAAFGWQGRMAGMGDPSGLIDDESDFLIHPAAIATGQGINYYGYYKFLYRSIGDFSVDIGGPSLDLPAWQLISLPLRFHSSGEEMEHESLIGAAFPLGKGRMGLFFGYNGMRGDLSGNEVSEFANASHDLDNALDNFNLRIIYGLPLENGWRLGAEVQISHQREDNTVSQIGDWADIGAWNTRNSPNPRPFPYAPPRDASFWEVLFKTGIQADYGPTKLGVTARGGPTFSSNNEWVYSATGLNVNGSESGRFDGDVNGWRVGGDFWLRHQVNERLALPFVVRADYKERTYGVSGTILGTGDSILSQGAGLDSLFVSSNNREEVLFIETGGGLDYTLANGLRFGAGLYYDYIRTRTSLVVHDLNVSQIWDEVYDYAPYPKSTEHRIKLKLSAEKPLDATYTLRGGLEFFRGWVSEKFSFSDFNLLPGEPNFYLINGAPDGERWGIMASIGATAKFPTFTVEPFIQGGWQTFSVDDETMFVTSRVNFTPVTSSIPSPFEKKREEAIVAAGLSIRF